MTTTPTLGLTQYEATDTINFLTQYNTDLSKIDTNAKANKSDLDGFELQLAQKASQVALNTEKTERLAEVAVERARINSFTALASGSTTGDAELIDGRTGSNSVIYPNIGGAIRGQFSELKEDLVENNEATFIYSYSTGTFVLKHINTIGNIEDNSNKNICFENYVLALKGSTVSVDSGYKYQIALYDKDSGNFVQRITWSTTRYKFTSDYLIRLEISDISESVLSDTSISSHLHYSLIASKIPTNGLSQVKSTKKLQITVATGLITTSTFTFKKNKLYTLSADGTITSGAIKISTFSNGSDILEEDFIEINSNSNQFYFVPKYDSEKIRVYTQSSYVGTVSTVTISEIYLTPHNIVSIPTKCRTRILEDCIVYDSDEKTLYIQKDNEWVKTYNEGEYDIGMNPVLKKMPDGITRIADPTIIRFNSAFYLLVTGDRIPIFKSYDMVNWEFYNYMMSEQDFNTVKTLTDNFLGTWAPDVIKIGNKWVCYVSLADSDYVNKSKVIAFTSDRPDEEWSYQTVVVDNPNNGVKECIDPDVFVENGVPYMFVGSFYNIYLFKLTSNGLNVDTSYTPKIIAYAGVVEGSYIYKKDEYYYLFLSNGTSSKDGNYKLKVARSTTIDGVYYNKNGVAITSDGSLATTILEGNGTNTFSVGHNGDIFVDRNGKYFIPFHGYTDQTTTKILFIQELLWGDDGFPYFENSSCSLEFKIPKF